MKRLLMILVFVLGAAGVLTAQETADQTAVRSVFQVYSQGINTLNADLWLSIWDDNGIKMDPDTKALIGKPVIAAAVKSRFSMFAKMNIDITVEEVNVAADLAVARGTFLRTITTKSGTTLVFDGKFMTLLRRQPDLSWKIYRDIFNSNVPPK